MPNSKQFEKWEEEFDKKFPARFHVDDKDFIGQTEKEELKFFIKSLLSRQRQEVIEEIEKMTICIIEEIPDLTLAKVKGFNEALQEVINRLKKIK